MFVGKLVWLQEEVRKEDISIALMIRERFSTSVLFKDILEAISLIQRYRTMWWLGLEYSLTFTTLDVHSIFILLSTMDSYLEVKIWAEDRQYSSCPLIQETKVTKILNILTSLYHVWRDSCTMHGRGTKQYVVFWVNIDFAISEGLTFYQTRSNAITLQGTLPAYCIPKVVRLKTEEVLYERRYLSPQPPPKISLKHDHNWTRGNDQLGSTVEQQLVGKLVQQSFGEAPQVKLSKPTQSKPNPICDRSGKPEVTERVFVEKGKTSRSQEIDDKRLQVELGSSDRTGNLWSLKTFA